VSTTSTKHDPGRGTLTLGELLYASAGFTQVSEKEWLTLVKAIAAGDEAALRLLYEKTSPLVFAYLLRLTGDRLVAEELLVQVFQNVWCEAPVFDSSYGPVIGWIMRQARSKALGYARETERLDGDLAATTASASEGRASIQTSSARSPADDSLQILDALSANEREAIQAVFVDGLSYAEGAARFEQSVGTFTSWVRSGLWKLQRVLQARGQDS
jgi:RNA polymerase sigma-70 factor, ECF subfamily